MNEQRRTFLILTAGFALGAVIWLTRRDGPPTGRLPDVTIEPNPHTGLDAAQWQAMDAVLGHLFPSEADAPGAQDAHATAWLHNALLMPDVRPDLREAMREGLVKLETGCQMLYSQPFLALDEQQREAALRALEQGDADGKAWLREVLRYSLEALLGDPVYGGNPDGIGWQWLRHTPGFPRPPADKRYFLL